MRLKTHTRKLLRQRGGHLLLKLGRCAREVRGVGDHLHRCVLQPPRGKLREFFIDDVILLRVVQNHRAGDVLHLERVLQELQLPVPEEAPVADAWTDGDATTTDASAHEALYDARGLRRALHGVLGLAGEDTDALYGRAVVRAGNYLPVSVCKYRVPLALIVPRAVTLRGAQAVFASDTSFGL